MDFDFQSLLESSNTTVETGAQQARGAKEGSREPRSLALVCCPDFDMSNVERMGGNMLCSSCGAVFDTIIESHEDNNSTSFHDAERCSKVDDPVDIAATYCGNTSFTTMTSRQRMFQQMTNEFKDLCKDAELPPVMVKEMMVLYREVYEKMSVRSYSVKRCNVKKGLMAACMYFACRTNKCSRDIKEIADVTGLTRKGVSSGCTLFAEIMGQGYFDMKPMSPHEFIDRFMTKTDTPWKYYDEIQSVTASVEQTHLLHEVTPNGVCAGIIYFVLCRNKEPSVDIDKFSKALGVSVTMIKKVSSRLQKTSN